MDKQFNDLISLANTKSQTLAFVTTGGGAGLFQLFKIPGCSKVLIEARMLYSKGSIEGFLEMDSPEKFVNQWMADKLALKMDSLAESTISFAITAALATDRVRKGADHAYLSIVHNNQIIYQMHIKIEGKDRNSQDDYLTKTVLSCLTKVIKEL